jgi:hypothetical protein
MRASDKPLHTVLQVIKAHGVMTRIAAGRLEPHFGGENVPDRQQAQSIEADQRYLLSELIYGDIADSEDRDPIANRRSGTSQWEPAARRRVCEQTSVDWTILRCGGFATNTLTWAATVRAEGMVRFPYGEAALALIAEQDIAAAAARVLLDSGHTGQTYVLTGAESLTQIRQAEAIGKAIGRPVRFEELSPEQFRQFAIQHSRHPWWRIC